MLKGSCYVQTVQLGGWMRCELRVGEHTAHAQDTTKHSAFLGASLQVGTEGSITANHALNLAVGVISAIRRG